MNELLHGWGNRIRIYYGLDDASQQDTVPDPELDGAITAGDSQDKWPQRDGPPPGRDAPQHRRRTVQAGIVYRDRE